MLLKSMLSFFVMLCGAGTVHAAPYDPQGFHLYYLTYCSQNSNSMGRQVSGPQRA